MLGHERRLAIKASNTEDETKAILKNVELRATRHRQEVLQVLLEHPTTPMTIDQLVERLPKNFDRVTAYRIVNTFAENGLVEKNSQMSNTMKVMLAPDLIKRHKHLVTCRICGSAYTVNICVQAGWRQKLSRLGFTNISHNLSFSGVCANH